MNDQTLKSTSTKGPRCRHYTDRGRRCQLPVVDTRSGFCFRHAKPQPAPSDSVDLSAELIGELSEFEFAVDINKFLAKLLVLLTKGRVSPRRASVLAYITNQLLHSLPAIDRDIDTQPGEDAMAQVLRNIPRPIRDEPPKVS